jgi:error-prone DNA polymerase
VPEATAERVFTQLRAFGGYAFPKSHAAAFAVITYQSAWLRHYHPAAFFAGLLRHQPMGFYPARVLISEARRHGVEIRPADVARSTLTPTVEEATIRLGLRAIRGVGEEAGTRLVEARRRGPFRSLADLCRRARLDRRAAEGLIMAGALDRWGIPRRQLLWDLEDALAQAAAPPALDLDRPDAPHFAALPERDRLWMERGTTATPTQGPLTERVRAQLRTLGVTPSGALARWPDGTRVRVGGAVVARQQPPTAHGMAFLALEDAEGFVNVALPPPVVQAYRRVILAPFVLVEGQVARDGAALNVMGARVLALAG